MLDCKREADFGRVPPGKLIAFSLIDLFTPVGVDGRTSTRGNLGVQVRPLYWKVICSHVGLVTFDRTFSFQLWNCKTVSQSLKQGIHGNESAPRIDFLRVTYEVKSYRRYTSDSKSFSASKSDMSKRALLQWAPGSSNEAPSKAAEITR